MENLFCFILVAFVFVVLGGMLWFRMSVDAEKEEKTNAARVSYQSALARLKTDPTNANLKQHALQEGRTYATWTREQKAVTIFDEMALSNDISAATAGATVAINSAPTTSVEDRLKTLEGLRAKGVVTDTEYAQKRQKLLDEM